MNDNAPRLCTFAPLRLCGSKEVSLRKTFAWAFALLLSLILLAGCGRARPGTPTPLPPGTPVPQPTPNFQGAAQAAPSPTLDVDAVKAQLATRVAQAKTGAAATLTPTPTPSPTRRVVAAPVRSAASAALLNRPTALGIVGGFAALVDAPGGRTLQTLGPGSTVTLTGKSADGGWYAAYLDDGQAGWIAAGQVQVFGDDETLEVVGESFSPAIVVTMLAEASRPQPAIPVGTPIPTRQPVAPRGGDAPTGGEASSGTGGQTAQGPTASGPTAIVQVDALNVRAGPGTEYPRVGAVFLNDTVRLLARNEAGDWLQIEFPAAPEGFGWVYAPLVAPAEPVESLPVSDRVSAAPAPAGSTAPQAQAVAGLSGRLVFQARSGGDIYLYDLAGGGLRKLTSGTDPALSPDGRTVAFVRGGGENGLYLIDSDGGNERRIFDGNAPRTPKFSPDGRYIVFSVISGYGECWDVGFGICLPNQPPPQVPARKVSRERRTLARVDLNGGDYRDLASLNSSIAPDWHPWGIVYQSNAGLQITQDAPDAQTRPFLNEPRYQDPDWQPGPGRVVFQSREGNHWEIFIANADGGGVAALTRPPLGAQPDNVSPAWSPDGKWIVFLSNRDGAWRLWVMDDGGGNLQKLPIDAAIEYSYQAEQVVDWGP